MSKAVGKRAHDVFLSHAHVDVSFANEVRDWLESAGFVVWFDGQSMSAGQQIADALTRGISDSRAMLVLATAEAVSKGWVRYEVGVAIDEHARDADFKVIVACIGKADMDALGRGFSKIQIDEPVLDLDFAKKLLNAFHPTGSPVVPGRTRDAYVSLSWSNDDKAMSHAICTVARNEGFRLIGDSKDRPSYSDNRIRDVMSTCGALIAILPWRDAEEAWADDEPRGKNPYRYFLREVDLAAEMGLPCCVIAPEGLHRVDGDDSAWLRLPKDTIEAPEAVRSALSLLYDDWVEPTSEDTVFFSTELETDRMLKDGTVRHLIQAITQMRMITGPDLHQTNTTDAIIDQLKSAQVVIADLTGAGDEETNLNVAIEAGIAYSHGRAVRLIAQGGSRRPPFMLRNTGQFPKYQSDLDRLALLRKTASQFRRRVYDDPHV